MTQRDWPPQVDQALSRWRELVDRQDDESGELASRFEKLTSRVAELLDARSDRQPFDRRKKELQRKLQKNLGSSAGPPPRLLRSAPRMTLGQLLKIEANLQRFVADLEEPGGGR